MQNIERVGRLIDLDGSLVWYTRKFSTGQPGVFQGYEGLPIYHNDVLQTDKNTRIHIAFLLGGQSVVHEGIRVAVGKNNVIGITPYLAQPMMLDMQDADSIEDLKKTTSILLHKILVQGVYQERVLNGGDKKFEIQTVGGTMGGIEG